MRKMAVPIVALGLVALTAMLAAKPRHQRITYSDGSQLQRNAPTEGRPFQSLQGYQHSPERLLPQSSLLVFPPTETKAGDAETKELSKHSAPILYPPNGMRDVPQEFDDSETPDPVPDRRGAVAGFPITATFYPGTSVKNVAVSLRDEKGKEIDNWVSTPDDPACKDYPSLQRNTVGVIPKRRLLNDMKYTFTLKFSLDGEDRVVRTSFLTAAESRTCRMKTLPKGSIDQIVLDRLNYYRRQVGVPAIRYHELLSDWSKLHADYLGKHCDHASAAGLAAHGEDKDLPGYSEEGHLAGRRSVILVHTDDPRHCIDDWMGVLLHRIPLLNPDLDYVGLGYSRIKDTDWVVVLDVLGGIKKRDRNE
jgi:uncharacterized protein YkwD